MKIVIFDKKDFQKKSYSELNSGFIVPIDPEDYDILAEHTWRINKHGYIIANIKNKPTRMHRFIMNPNENEIVDHINKIRHDNRKINLRIIDLESDDANGNSQNVGIRKDKRSSKYRGVYFVKDRGYYNAFLTVDKIAINLGYYKSEIEAAEQVDMYIVHTNNKFIPMNFPEKKEEYLKRKYKKFLPNKNKKTKFIGVCKNGSKYVATVTHNKNRIYLGIFKDQISAAKSYDKYIVENKIPGKKLNFSENWPGYDPKSIIKTEYKDIEDEYIIVQLIINSAPKSYVVIDREDYDKIKYYTWFLNDRGYVITDINKSKIKLSRMLMNESDPKVYIDHIDGDIHNNTKKNLRRSDKVKNPRNCLKQKNTTSKYIGVTYNLNRWVTHISFHNVDVFHYRDKSELHAAVRRDLFILDNFPNEHYKMNFVWTPKDIKKWKTKLGITDNTIHLFKNQIIKNTIKLSKLLCNKNVDFKAIEKINKTLTKQHEQKTLVYCKILNIT